MNNRSYKIVLASTAHFISLLKEISINKKAIAYLSNLANEATAKINSFTEQYHNQEYYKTLSPAEQKCLMENVKIFYQFHGEIRKELDYLDMTRTPEAVRNAITILEKAYVLSQIVYKHLGESPENVAPYNNAIKLPNFHKADYIPQIDAISADVEAFAYDLLYDHLSINIVDEDQLMYKHAGKTLHLYILEAAGWLNIENDRLKSEGIPETKKFTMPKEITPEELPASPQDN